MQILKFIALLGAVAIYLITSAWALVEPETSLMIKSIAVFALGLVVTVAALDVLTRGSRR